MIDRLNSLNTKFSKLSTRHSCHSFLEFRIKMEKIVSENATITVIKEGYAYLDEEGWMRANASCTLVQTAESTVIVDTLTPWDGPFILEKLGELGVTPDAITHVVSTHGHSDHNGNNNLFLSAKQHIVGFCVSYQDKYYTHPFELDEPLIIDPHLKIIPTPGHTNEDISLIVTLRPNEDPDNNNYENTLAIAGDLFESESDLLNSYIWTPNSSRPEIQVKNRLKVLKMAKTIIPGHGKMFKVLPEHVQAAEELVKQYEKVQ